MVASLIHKWWMGTTFLRRKKKQFYNHIIQFFLIGALSVYNGFIRRRFVFFFFLVGLPVLWRFFKLINRKLDRFARKKTKMNENATLKEAIMHIWEDWTVATNDGKKEKYMYISLNQWQNKKKINHLVVSV